jgi:hypothetical protein
MMFPEVKAVGRGIALDYDREQSIKIMEKLPKKNFVDMGQISQANIGQIPQVDYEIIGKMIGMAVSAAMKPVVEKLEMITGQKRKGEKSIPAPSKTARARLRQLVSEYAVKLLDGDHQGAWHRLYAEIYYRCEKNITVLAKNSRISKLDMIERMGLIDESCAILVEMMGE